MTEQQRTTRIIDEDGLPVMDGDPGAAQSAGQPGQHYPGMPGMVPGLPPIPPELLNRKGNLSLLKLIGWKGAAVLALLIAAVIGLAFVSLVVAAFALPVLLLVGVIGWLAAKIRGSRTAPSRTVVRR